MLRKAGRHIDRESEDARVEEVGVDRLHGGDAAHQLRGDVGIGGLRGRTDRYREVEKVPEIGIGIAVEVEAAASLSRAGLTIIEMRVMDREDGLHESPRTDHRRRGEGEMSDLVAVILALAEDQHC